MLFDHWQSGVLLVCIAPANTDLIRNFYHDKARVRLLEIKSDFSDAYLVGHAKRVGLAADCTPQEVLDRLLPTIRYDMRFGPDRIRDADLPSFYQLREGATVDENTVPPAEFLDIPLDKARQIANTHHLFTD